VNGEVTPRVLVLVCPLSIKNQAAASGLSTKQFRRLTRQSWDKWRIGSAENWCTACGVSLFNLTLTPKLSANVADWKSEDPEIVAAFKDVCTARIPGIRLSIRKLRDYASMIEAAAKPHRPQPEKGPSCGLPD
jgi:hypothetical protein